MMRRLLRYVSLSLTTLAVIVLLLILWIGYTQPGLQLSIKLLQTILPGELVITQAKGQLFHKIKFADLSYRQDGLQLTIDDAQMRWQPYTWLWQQLTVHRLDVRQIDIKQTADKSTSSTDPWDWLDFRLPFTINLNKVNVRSIKWQSADDTVATTIEQLQLTLRATQHEIHQLDLTATTRQHDIAAQGKISWQPPFDGDLQISVTPQPQASTPIEGQLTVKGNFDQVTFDLTMEDPWAIHAKGTIDERWDVKWYADVDQINSQGNIKGDRAHPVFSAHNQAQKLRIGDSVIEQIMLRIHHEWGQHGAFQSELVIDGLESEQTRVDRIQLLLDGTLTNHQLKIQVQQAAKQWQTVIDGEYANDIWQGALAFVNYKDQTGELWQINQVSTLTITPWATPATAQLTIPQLSWLTQLLPDDIARANGQIQAKFELDKKAFDWRGHISLEQASITLTQSNITLQNLHLTAKKSVDKPWQFDGEATSNDGQLTLASNPDNTAVELSGQNFTLVNTDELFMNVSPELSLSLQDEQVQVTGRIVIPKARIEPVDYSDSIALPADVVFVKQQEQTSSAMKWLANIDIILGDDITLDYLGVSALLTGKINVIEASGQPTYATGQIDLVNGKFHYLSQTLNLDYGHINYTNSIIDEPTLSIRASKEISTTVSRFSLVTKKTIVGIKIEGQVPEPTVTLFSIPSGLSESDILSLLVLGKTISEASSGIGSKDNSALLIQASAALGLESTTAVGQIREAFGIDQLGLETEKQTQAGSGGIMEKTSLVVGKAITPRLFVSYHVNLLGQQNRFSGNIVRFRYLLRPKLVLQTETDGNDNSVDLLYIIERE
jgi:autotransporter translocation and assembly factor TamB